MSIFLDKLLTAFALPPGSLLLAAILGLAARGAGLRRLGNALLLLSLLAGWFCSTPFGAWALMYPLEARYPPTPVDEVPLGDVIVVLGGGVAPLPADGSAPDLWSGADRYWLGARLYRAGRAPVVLVSGGNAWSGRGTEARAMRALLTDLGVPGDAVELEERSRNTHENALLSARHPALAGDPEVLLVTSAFHMQRALLAFRREGVAAVTPVATDHTHLGAEPLVIDLLPDADALATSARALHEYLGLLVYRFRGWI